jgi:glycosyltransferase involved in cell wall biosynthesis
MSPNITVIIPSYNSAQYIAEALISAQAQTLPPQEIIVVDDGSRDESPELARNAGVTLITQANRGPGAARNTGLRASRSDWVAFLDADDVWEPAKLQKQAELISAHPDLALVWTDYALWGDEALVPSAFQAEFPNYRSIPKEQLGPTWARFNPPNEELAISPFTILPSVTVVRKQVIESLGMFDEALLVGADYDLFLRLMKHYPVAAVEESLAKYRLHLGSQTRQLLLRATGMLDLTDKINGRPHEYPASVVKQSRLWRINPLDTLALYYLPSDKLKSRSYASESFSLRPSWRPALRWCATWLPGNIYRWGSHFYYPRPPELPSSQVRGSKRRP